MLNHIVQTFEDQGWAYQKVADVDVIETGFEAHHGKVQLHIQGFAPLNAVSVVSESAVLMSSIGARDKAVELIMRVNELLTVGNFEYRWDSGVTMFRATNLFSEGSFDGAILITLVEAAIVEMDRMTPCLSIIAKASPLEMATLDVEELMQRDDLIPNPGEAG